METYFVLLRGINVGGNNIMKMVELRELLEQNDCEDVKTYIQSGNVVFSHKKTTTSKLEEKLEKLLAKRFDYDATVIVLEKETLKKIIEEAPNTFGKEDEKYKYSVIFLKQPLQSKEVVEKTPVREGVDTVYEGKNAVYFTRLTAQLSKSKMSKLITTDIYPYISIRNWKATTKLFQLQ